MSLAYVCYVIADQYLDISGVVSVVMAALTVAAYGPTHLHPRQWTTLRQLWRQLEFWSNCLIFVLASMLAASVLLQITWLYIGALLGVAARGLRGPRAGRVRHAAAAGDGPPRAAGRPALQGDPGVGRPARRGHHRARHGRGGRRSACRRMSANSPPCWRRCSCCSPCSSTPPRSAW